MLPLLLFGAFVIVPLALIGGLIFVSATAPLPPDVPLADFADAYRLLEPEHALVDAAAPHDADYYIPSSRAHGGTWHVYLN